MINYICNNNTSVLNEEIKSSTLEELNLWLNENTIFGFDIETSGLNFIDNEMIMLQIGNSKDQFVIDIRNTNMVELKKIIKPVFENSIYKKIAHNAKFDIKFLRKYDIIPTNLWDTYVVEDILTKGLNLPLSLNKVLKRRIKTDPYKNYNKKETQISFTTIKNLQFSQHQIKYSSIDVKYLIQLANLQNSQINNWILKWLDITKVIQMENTLVEVLAEMEFNGISIDKKRWKELAILNKQKSQQYKNKLDSLVFDAPELSEFIPKFIQTRLDITDEVIDKVGINWDSPKQVLKVFQKINPIYKSINKDVLERVITDNLIIETYKEYRKNKTLESKFGIKFFNHLYSDGKLHTQFIQNVNTGRIASNNPNLQTIPADNNYRNCFITGDKDYVFVSGDFVSQELTILAWLSKDPVFLDALENGKDLHSICAKLLFKEQWEKATLENCNFKKTNKKCKCPEHMKLRTYAKTNTFGLTYGMYPNKLATKLKITVQEATIIMDTFFKTFPSIKKILDKSAAFAKQNGYITSLQPYNRIRRLYKNSNEVTNWSQIERYGKNTKFQSTGADMTKHALVVIYKHIIKNRLPVKLILTVHDEINTICHREYAEMWSLELKEIMEESAKIIIPSGILKASVIISEKWEK